MKKYSLLILILVKTIIGCKKNSELPAPTLTLEDTVSQRTLLFLDSIGVPNPSLQDMIGYDGNPLGRGVNTQRLAGNLIDAILTEAQKLSEQKITKIYPSEGINKPEHKGLVYSYGPDDITQRLFPTAGSDIHRKYAVYGTDCSGFMIYLIRNAGINIPETNVENFESTFRSAIANNPTYNSLILKNLGNIPRTQLKSGDFIIWINPGERHIGIISTAISPETMIFQSNGDPKPQTEAEQQKNLEQSRGVHPLGLVKAITGNGYWGPDYEILRLEDPHQSITDFNGNIYNTVIIGTQVWMKENLNTASYRNGDPIPQVTNPTVWANLTTGAWCYYDNNPINEPIYGKLYNWYAVNDPRGLAPQWWHIPTDAEWTNLTTYLGGNIIAGGKMKAVSPLWANANTNATNSSGFTGLPGGILLPFAGSNGIGIGGHWWSSTENSSSNAWVRILSSGNGEALRTNYVKSYGFSVRCIKN